MKATHDSAFYVFFQDSPPTISSGAIFPVHKSERGAISLFWLTQT